VKAEEPVEGDGDEDFEAASAEEAASLFSSELDSGEVIQDPVYGIIFKEAPAEVDDLKEIKGVAKVLEGKLNGVGVYRFKQVAVWTDAACAEFSKMLTFKNRIYTDNWLAQAKEFHEKKYGEKIE
jgi:predicted flap endonuclease-1-like 5' DNA nuclease